MTGPGDADPVAAEIDRLLLDADALIDQQPDAALTLGEQALALCRSLRPPDTARQAAALSFLGRCHYHRAAFHDALEAFSGGLERARALGDAVLQALCLNGLGISWRGLGDFGRAIGFQLENLRLVRAGGDERGLTRALINVGNIHYDLEEYSAALEVHLEVYGLARRRGNADHICIGGVNAALAAAHLGDHTRARALAGEALQLAQLGGQTAWEAAACSAISLSHFLAGEYPQAITVGEQALVLCRKAADRENETLVRAQLGRAYLEVGQPDLAEEQLSAALALAEEIDLRTGALTAHHALADLHERARRWPEAVHHLRAAGQLERRLLRDLLERRADVTRAQLGTEYLQQVAQEQKRRNAELEGARGELQHLAHHDMLTGLPNRRLFEERLEQAIAQAAPGGQPFAVMLLDLDGFKRVNDALGHNIGDLLLTQVAQRLQGALRAGDTVARLGGDEFTVIACQLDDASGAAVVARRLLWRLSAPFELAGQAVSVGASIGVSLYPHDAQDAVTLQRQADEAMYTVKRGGKRTVQFYNASAPA